MEAIVTNKDIALDMCPLILDITAQRAWVTMMDANGNMVRNIACLLSFIRNLPFLPGGREHDLVEKPLGDAVRNIWWSIRISR